MRYVAVRHADDYKGLAGCTPPEDILQGSLWGMQQTLDALLVWRSPLV